MTSGLTTPQAIAPQGEKAMSRGLRGVGWRLPGLAQGVCVEAFQAVGVDAGADEVFRAVVPGAGGKPCTGRFLDGLAEGEAPSVCFTTCDSDWSTRIGTDDREDHGNNKQSRYETPATRQEG